MRKANEEIQYVVRNHKHSRPIHKTDGNWRTSSKAKKSYINIMRADKFKKNWRRYEKYVEINECNIAIQHFSESFELFYSYN